MKKKLGVIQSHVEGLLEQGGTKLAAAVSDLFGVSGWAMLEQIAKGVTDVEVLAGEARGVLRKKDAELKEAFLAPPNERTLVRKFKRMLKEFGQLGLDVRALLDQQLATPA